MPTTRATSPKARRLQAQAAAAKRHNHPDKDDIAREYAEQRLAECVTKIVAEAPPLSDQQIENVVAILRAGGGAK